MWNRADLKANAKKIFFGNYWKAVLVTLILTIILGGATNTITRRISNNQSTDWSIDQDFSGVSSYDEWSNDEILNIGNSSLYGSEYQTYLRIYNRLKNIPGSVWAMLGIAVAVGIVVGLLISIFLVAPLQVGCYRWYILNRTSNPPMGELLNSFRNGYFNTAKIMFCKGLYTTLWSLLFIIPGIIKAYEYSMIPYLLAENPNMSKQEGLFFIVDLQLAPRHHGGGRVKEEGGGVGRHGNGDGVGPQHGPAPEGGHHDRLGIGHAHADHVRIRGHFGVIPGDAVMVGVAHHHHADAGGLGLFDGLFHPKAAGQLPHHLVRVDHRGDRGLKHHLGPGLRIHHAKADLLVVAHQALQAMGFDAVQVRAQQHIGHLLALLFGKAVFREQVPAKVQRRLVVYRYVSHRTISPLKFVPK